MRELLEGADRYCKQSTWKTFAVLKTCVLSLGLMMGMALPKNWKKVATIIAGIVFVVTYVPLMIEFYRAMFAKDE